MYKTIQIEASEDSLFTYLQHKNIDLPAACGGSGNCGKCKVRILSAPAPLPVSSFEKSTFSKKELEEGWRLACRQKALAGMRVQIPLSEEIQAEVNFHRDFFQGSIDPLPDFSGVLSQPVIALDLGSTTLAAALADPLTNKILKTASGVNHQRRWGADVISRIEAANKGASLALRRSICNDIRNLAKKMDCETENTSFIVSGNTTMLHLLEGLSCKGLGVAPYTPTDISLHTVDNITYLPGISGYVGADIVSGIAACGMDQGSELCLLLDLGTNGEMALGNKDGILVASTAAGPAFEGGNIRCGCAGIPGAIDSVSIQDSVASIHTIDEKNPVGICGSGVLETVYELRKNELADESGLLVDSYFESGFPLSPDLFFTQKDIREVQLANAAIRAGIETLLASGGFSYKDISHLYLAGGFGKKLNIEKAAGIGLLPKELLPVTEAVGNSSLAGALLFALYPSERPRFEKIPLLSREVILAESQLFSRLYIDSMLFPQL